MVRRDDSSDPDRPQDLWIMDLEGNYVSQVTHEPSEYSNYSWAPPREK